MEEAMKVILEPTEKFITINGNVRCRVWQGHTEGGIPIHAHIALVGVERDHDGKELEDALSETAEVRADVARLPDAVRVRHGVD